MKLEINFGVRRTQVLRPIVTTQAQANTFYRIYAKPLAIWQEGARTRILPEYTRTLSEMVTDSPNDIELIIQQIASEIEALIADWRFLFRVAIGDISMWHLRRLVGNLKYATNVDLSSMLTANDMPETLEAVLNRNVELIRNISDQARGRIGDIVFRGFTSRAPVAEIAREINGALDLGRKRARRIASDQVVKLSAALDRGRMQEIGITEFQWDHSGKAHPREWHLARDGKRFRFDDPKLRGDMPGDQPFCGCKARGVIE